MAERRIQPVCCQVNETDNEETERGGGGWKNRASWGRDFHLKGSDVSWSQLLQRKSHPSIFTSTWHRWAFLSSSFHPRVFSPSLCECARLILAPMFHLFPTADKRQFVLGLIRLIDLLLVFFFIEAGLPADRLVSWRSKNRFFLSCCGCCPNRDATVSTSKMCHFRITLTVAAHTEWTISPWQQSTTWCSDKWADIFPSYTSSLVALGICCYCPGMNNFENTGLKYILTTRVKQKLSALRC